MTPNNFTVKQTFRRSSSSKLESFAKANLNKTERLRIGKYPFLRKIKDKLRGEFPSFNLQHRINFDSNKREILIIGCNPRNKDFLLPMILNGIDHEYLHDILFRLEGLEARDKLDNLEFNDKTTKPYPTFRRIIPIYLEENSQRKKS